MIEDFSNFITKNKFALKLKNKVKGIVYTPKHIVINMLDMLNYSSKHILNKHIIDNSCGEGAF